MVDVVFLCPPVEHLHVRNNDCDKRSEPQARDKDLLYEGTLQIEVLQVLVTIILEGQKLFDLALNLSSRTIQSGLSRVREFHRSAPIP